ncbi:endonuclease/exonuclease/phosphatase family protein [Naasia lichenicola]|uniref:Endonuclease/exonuclease/phosphatase family protein n=1 Tax=Naasia lichenicola TaxID=2565933 RepID=A0A4S4FGH3_9MICO|nr:endonuclease/exonuclease/phosphatase family protein [Naasia lichenicola]THG29349.1 endonuclease/exonuclease/phosphatase family protein [Naasia lichenicola]
MSSTVIGRAAPPGVHLMSINLRRRLPFARRQDRWAHREPLVAELLGAELPTILGVQEALPDQDAAVERALGDGYSRIGRGRRADGSDERCSIHWDARRLELEDWTQLALSTRPDRPGSRSWGAVFPRIAVIAEFRDRADGSRLTVINTHLDPFSGRARSESARLLLAEALRHGGAVAVMGDLNARQGSPALRILQPGCALRDSWAAADQRLTPAWRTHSGYRRPSIGPRIDWILVGPDLRVRSAAVNARRWGMRATSDHEAVQAVVEVAPSLGSRTFADEPERKRTER